MLTIDLHTASIREFESGLKDYIDVSKKDTQYAVERQMKKVLVGAKGVKGLVHYFKEDAPTAAQIRKETDPHTMLYTTGWRGQKRKLRHAPKGSKVRKAILASRIKGKFFLSGNFNFRHWKPQKSTSKNRVLLPTARRNKTQIKNTQVAISNRMQVAPKTAFTTTIPGIIAHESRRRYIPKALKNALRDMETYIVQNWNRQFNRRF